MAEGTIDWDRSITAVTGQLYGLYCKQSAGWFSAPLTVAGQEVRVSFVPEIDFEPNSGRIVVTGPTLSLPAERVVVERPPRFIIDGTFGKRMVYITLQLAIVAARTDERNPPTYTGEWFYSAWYKSKSR